MQGRMGGVDRPVRIYRNMDVEKIVAAIPGGHLHTRLAIFLPDQVIVLQEASVAAIVRAYAATAIHPTRRGIVLVNKRLGKNQRKPGFAEHQLVEDGGEEEAVETMERLAAAAERGFPENI